MGRSALKKNVDKGVDALEEALHDLRRAVDKAEEQALDSLSETGASLSRAAEALAVQARAHATEALKSAGENVKAHPAATAGVIAAAAGLVAVLIARSRHPLASD